MKIYDLIMFFIDYINAIFTSKKCKDCAKFSENQYNTYNRSNSYGFCQISKGLFYSAEGNKRPCILFRNKK